MASAYPLLGWAQSIYERIKRRLGGEESEGVGVLKDKELKLDEMKVSRTQGGAGGYLVHHDPSDLGMKYQIIQRHIWCMRDLDRNRPNRRGKTLVRKPRC